MTNDMVKAVCEDAGLGLVMDKNNPSQFGHNGADEGFQAILTMNAESGKGVAIMANSDNGIAVGDFLLRSVAKEYGWNYKSAGQGAFPMLVLIAKTKGTQAALQRYAELKKSPAAEYKVEERTLNALGYTLLFSGQVQDAITVFQRNVEEYPQSGTVSDSLGEADMKDVHKEFGVPH